MSRTIHEVYKEEGARTAAQRLMTVRPSDYDIARAQVYALLEIGERLTLILDAVEEQNLLSQMSLDLIKMHMGIKPERDPYGDEAAKEAYDNTRPAADADEGIRCGGVDWSK